MSIHFMLDILSALHSGLQRNWKILCCHWSSVVNDLKENLHFTKILRVNCKATDTSEWKYSSSSTSEIRGDLERMFDEDSETRVEDRGREKNM